MRAVRSRDGAGSGTRLEAPFSTAAFPSSTTPQLVLDDAELLTGAASVWAVLKFAQTVPATPETLSELERAETLFVAELMKVGLTQSDVERQLCQPCEGGVSGGSNPLAG